MTFTLQELILGFLQSCKTDNVDSTSKEKLSHARYDIIKHAIHLLSSSDIDLSTSLANTLISSLNTNIGYISTPKELFNIAETAVDTFQSNAPSAFYALDIIPAALAVASATTDQAIDAVESIISRICSHSWPSSTIAHVLSALRAFPITKESTIAALRQATSLARTADVQDLPSIAHQLLLLADTSSCREFALQELIRLFDRLERGAGITSNPTAAHTRLIQVEAAVLMHLEMTIKHDIELGHSWIRQIKSPEWTPTPFAFALSFVVAGVPRHEQHVLTALRDRLLKSHNDVLQMQSSPWLIPTLSLPSTDMQKTARTTEKNDEENVPATAMESALMQCLKNSGHGQAIGAQPVVSLAIMLLEHSISATNNNTVAVSHAVDLGIQMLAQTFGAHKSSRKHILSMCSARLIGVSDRASAPFVRALGAMVCSHPHAVESHASEVKVVLENLVLLPPNAALQLLEAMWPLCRAQRDVADLVVMLLRKAMFHRELDARLIAARGFLYLISEELRCAKGGSGMYGSHHGGAGGSGGGSGNLAKQNLMDDKATGDFDGSQHIPVLSQLEALTGGSGSGASLLHELMGFLRRCLAQQPEVRRAVYRDIPAVISADPAVAESIAELLLPHLATFCEQNEMMTPPLKLEACARLSQDGVVRLVEPLQDLLACIRAVVHSSSLVPSKRASEKRKRHVLYTSDDEDGDDENDSKNINIQNNNTDNRILGASINTDDETASTMLRNLFASLRRRLSSCPLEDFCFDRSTVFSINDPHGELHQAHADMLLGAYEVCMEDVVSRIDECTDMRRRVSPGSKEMHARCEGLAVELLALFRQHHRLMSLAMDAIKASSGGGSTHATRGGRALDGLGQGINATNQTTSKKKTQSKSSFSLEKRSSALSLQCLARLLDAMVDDGLVSGGCNTGHGGQSAHVELARNPDFQAFVMASCVHALHAIIDSSNGRGTVDWSDRKNDARWMECIAPPMLRAIHTIVLACAQQRGHAASKKEKVPSEQLMLSSVVALDCILRASCSSSHELAAVLAHAPILQSSPGSKKDKLQRIDVDTDRMSDRLAYFEQLLKALVSNVCTKELDILCHCLSTRVIHVLPPRTVPLLASWVDSIVLSSPQALSHHHQAARSLVSLQLRSHAASGTNKDFEILLVLGKHICERVNLDDGATMQTTGTLNFSMDPGVPLLSSDTVNALMIESVTHIEESLPSLEWALGHSKAMGDVAIGATTDKGSLQDRATVGSFAAAYDRAGWERCAFSRMLSLIHAVHALTSAQLRGPPMEALAKALIKIFRALCTAAKSQLAGKGQVQCAPGKVFQDLAHAVNAELTPQVYAFITEVEMEVGAAAVAASENDAGNTQADDSSGKKALKAKKKGGITKAQRDIIAKTIPSLIYQVEEWEKHLIRVSKAGKLNLMLHAKRATNRDFRLVATNRNSART